MKLGMKTIIEEDVLGKILKSNVTPTIDMGLADIEAIEKGSEYKKTVGSAMFEAICRELPQDTKKVILTLTADIEEK